MGEGVCGKGMDKIRVKSRRVATRNIKDVGRGGRKCYLETWILLEKNVIRRILGDLF